VVQRGIKPLGRPALDEEIVLIPDRLLVGNISSVLAKGGHFYPYDQAQSDYEPRPRSFLMGPATSSWVKGNGRRS